MNFSSNSFHIFSLLSGPGLAASFVVWVWDLNDFLMASLSVQYLL